MKYVIEFRNGGFYGGEINRSVSFLKAQRFDTKEEADKVASWYTFAGPLVLPVSEVESRNPDVVEET